MTMDANARNNQHCPQVDMEDAPQLVKQVKDEIQRCLDACMTKERMFQELREKGIQPEITFAVYKELRAQNKNFFKAYFSMMDLNRQIQRFNLLLGMYNMMQQQSKTSSSHVPNHSGVEPSSSGVRPYTLSVTTPPVVIPDTAWLLNHQGGPVWQDHNQLGASGGINGLTAWAPQQSMMYLQAKQDASHLQQLPNWWGVTEVPLAVDPSNAFMGGSWPPP